MDEVGKARIVPECIVERMRLQELYDVRSFAVRALERGERLFAILETDIRMNERRGRDIGGALALLQLVDDRQRICPPAGSWRMASSYWCA